MANLEKTYQYAGGRAVTQNRVVRNTYWLLSLSMIPTVLGAAVGLYTGINRVMGASPGLSAIVFLVGAFGLMFAIEKNKNSSLGVVLLLAFTFFMGVMLSRLLGFVMGMSNGSQLVMTAFGGTAIDHRSVYGWPAQPDPDVREPVGPRQ
jgi:modulator of FtsH protease